MFRPRPRRLNLILLGAGITAVIVGGCGEQKPESGNRAAQLFAERCSGCHSLKAAGAQGSAGVRPTGPNLNQRHETPNQVLYAIRNGGFSGAIMPQNIVLGGDAKLLAAFVAKNAGTEAKSPPSVNPAATGSSGSGGQSSGTAAGQ